MAGRKEYGGKPWRRFSSRLLLVRRANGDGDDGVAIAGHRPNDKHSMNEEREKTTNGALVLCERGGGIEKLLAPGQK